MLHSSLGRQVLVILVLVAGTSGCVSTATVHVWQPAEVDIVGVRRLAVLDFRGPDDRGRIARSALVSELAANGFYELVDQGQLVPAHMANGPPDVNQVIHAARAQGVDGLLVGDVVSYDAVDDIQRDQNFQFGGASKRDEKADAAQMLMGMRIENNETINREVSAALSFQLIDVRTGSILAARQTAHTDIGTMTNGEGYLPARERALTELMNLCARDIVHMVAPHQVPFDVDLATASWGKAAKLIRAGNQSANNGDWTLAAQHWQTALEIDPESHAAMHNLAIAREFRMDYPGADRLLSEAIQLKRTSLYAKSQARVERHKARYLTTMAQHDARTPHSPTPPAYAGPPPSAPRPRQPVQSAAHNTAGPSNATFPGNTLRR